MVDASVIRMLKTFSLLYVEDNESVRNATMETLNQLFSTVTDAIDGRDGLEKYERYRPDMIFTDLNMPNVNGLIMIEEIRKKDRETPIIVCSASDDASYFIRSISLEVNGYLQKPLEISPLLRTFEKAGNILVMRRELALKTSLMRQYQEITDQSSIVSKANIQGIITYVNDGFCELTGYSREELVGRSHRLVSDLDTPGEVYAQMWKSIRDEKKLYQGILKNRKKTGSPYYSKTTIMPLLNEANEITEYIAIHTDVSDMMQPIRQLYDYLEQIVFATVILFKIEGYTHLEHFFGEKVAEGIGKQFVKKFDTQLRSLFEEGNVYPLDQGYIALISPLITEDNTVVFIEKIKKFQQMVYKNRLDIDGMEYDVAVIAAMAQGKYAFENARSAISEMEIKGEQFLIARDYREEVKQKAKRNIDILQQLKRAIDSGRIQSFFQPIVDNRTKEIVKYESLVRMIDEEGRIIPPGVFLEVAKQAKFYFRITEEVLKHSFEALYHTSKSISINLSVLDVERTETRESIIGLLHRYKNDAHRIVFELLEEEAVNDMGLLESFISYVKTFGVQIAIDDFGSGYSNYQRLMQYQPDILKIDGSLIKTVHTDIYVHSVVRSLVSLAKENGIRTLAEFVENDDIYRCVCDLGIEFSQGYLFGKPESTFR